MKVLSNIWKYFLSDIPKNKNFQDRNMFFHNLISNKKFRQGEIIQNSIDAYREKIFDKALERMLGLW